MNKNSQNPTEQIQADTSQEPGTGIPASVPTGWKLVPVEPTDEAFIDGGYDRETAITAIAKATGDAA